MQKIFNKIIPAKMPNTFNPWREADALDAGKRPWLARRERLRQHFDCAPKLLLIGEASGYQGCHFSGIPFTNEKLILEGKIPRVTASDRITTRGRPWCEPSATIVWGTLHELGIAESTVLWNAFAWHPHLPGNVHSNRTPTPAEFAEGQSTLQTVLQHFPGVPVIAVGQKSQALLARLGIAVNGCVRHPAMGGATAFRQGMSDLATQSAAKRARKR